MLKYLRWWVPLVAGVFGLMIGGMLVPVMIFLQPQRYRSHATVEIKLPPVLISPNEEEPPFDRPRFLAEEAGKFTSDRVLWDVVNSLDLEKKWAVEAREAIVRLKSCVDIAPVHGTDLFELTVTLTNKEDSRDVLHGLVKSYAERRRKEEEIRSDAALVELSAEIKKQEAVVEQGREKIRELLQRSGNDLESDKHLEIESDEIEETKQKREDEIVGKKIFHGLDHNPLIIHDNPSITAPSPFRLGKLPWMVAAVSGLFTIGSIPLMGWRRARERALREG